MIEYDVIDIANAVIAKKRTTSKAKARKRALVAAAALGYMAAPSKTKHMDGMTRELKTDVKRFGGLYRSETTRNADPHDPTLNTTRVRRVGPVRMMTHFENTPEEMRAQVQAGSKRARIGLGLQHDTNRNQTSLFRERRRRGTMNRSGVRIHGGKIIPFRQAYDAPTLDMTPGNQLGDYRNLGRALKNAWKESAKDYPSKPKQPKQPKQRKPPSDREIRRTIREAERLARNANPSERQARRIIREAERATGRNPSRIRKPKIKRRTK